MFHSPFKGLVAFVVVAKLAGPDLVTHVPHFQLHFDGILHTTHKRKLLLVFYVVLGA